MRIFITGGTGFIGSRVVAELKGKHKVEILKHRLHELKKIEKDLKRFKPDVVLHLAWEGIPNVGIENSAKNLIGSLQFFELIGKLRVPKLMTAGSAWMYEDPEELLRSGHGPFIAAKNAIKVFGEAIMRGSGGTFVWFNPFFVYGAGKKAASLVPSLIAQAREGNTPTPKNPDAWHDFIYIDDLAHAIALLATKKVPTGSYDLGTGKLTRTGDVAHVVAKLAHLPLIPLRKVGQQGKRADIRAIQKATGWRPRFTIEKGMKATWQNYL